MSLVVVKELLENLDNGLFVHINSGLGCAALDDFFLPLSALGAWPIVLVAIAGLASFSRRVLLTHLLVLMTMLLVLAPLGKQMKRLFHRSRPQVEFAEAEHARMPPVRLVGTERMQRRSFPSGHTMLAFFTMVYLGLVRPGCRRWALALACGVALARVYVGAHFPLDVLGGALFGSAGGWAAWRVFLIADRRFNQGRGVPA